MSITLYETPNGILVPNNVRSLNRAQYDPDGSLTWLKRLDKKIRWRNAQTAIFDSYYRGNHPLQFASPKFRTTFGDMFGAFADNWTGLVVDAVTERLNPQGFRLGSGSDKGDKDAWYYWQANNLDAEIKMGFTESLIREESYLLVWTDPDDDSVPLITVEDPSQAIVMMSSLNRRKRAAGAKFMDDDNGFPCAIVYLPTGIYKYRAMTKDYRANDSYQSQMGYLLDRPNGGASNYGGSPAMLNGTAAFATTTAQWQPWDDDPADKGMWPLPNPLKVVPLIPLRNKPRLLNAYLPGVSDAESEIKNVLPLQDATNKYMTDLLLASEYAAFQQRHAVGVEQPIDPITGLPGKFPTGPGTMLASPNPEAKFGSFPELSGDVHIKAIETCVQHIASQSRTPPHYFYLSGHFPSGEAIKSAETGLVAKVRDKQVVLGEALEEAMRLAFLVMEDSRGKIRDSETIWRDPESRTESEHIDAVVKRIALGVPLRQLWEDAGYTEAQMERFRGMRLDEIRDYVLAQAQALAAMAAAGLPSAAISGGAAPGAAGAPGAAPSATGQPVGLPVPGASGQNQELISVPGSPVATTIRGPRDTL